MDLPLKFTIIIPTLQRPDTLYWTLKTVVEQDYSDFRIIVSDNFSNDDTPLVVTSFSDPRISYINPGKRLSMSRHWEFALSHVNEGFITILGDDDALIPGALSNAASVLKKFPVKAVGWRFGNFNWPGLPPYFMIPLGNNFRLVDSRKEISKIFKGSIISTIQFPSLYGGFIDVALINKIREKFGGQFFHSRIPDFFSAAAIASNVEQYLRLEYPLSINATSKHSTGYSTINPETNQKSIDDLVLNNDNIPVHSDLIFLKSINLAIAEALLQVHELMPDFPKVDMQRLLREIVIETRLYSNETRRNEILEGVRAIANKNNLGGWVEKIIKEIEDGPVQQGVIAKRKYSPLSQTLYVMPSENDFPNVYIASQFVGKIMPKRFFNGKWNIGSIANNLLQTWRYFIRRYVLKLHPYS